MFIEHFLNEKLSNHFAPFDANHSQIHYLEVGMSVRAFRVLDFPKHKGLRNSNFLYTSMEEYLNDYTTYDALTYQNFESLFQVHLVVCLSLLLVAKRRWLFYLLNLSALVRSKTNH